MGERGIVSLAARFYFLKTATRLAPASASSITAVVLISIRSAHFAAPLCRAAALSGSYRAYPPLQSTLCQRPSKVTPASGVASPARNCTAAVATDPGIRDQVDMNFIAFVLQFRFLLGKFSRREPRSAIVNQRTDTRGQKLENRQHYLEFKKESS